MIDELKKKRAENNLKNFNNLMKDLKKLAVMNGKNPNKFLKELGKVKLDELKPETFQEILDRI